MRQRLISAAVLVPVVVILFVLGAPWLTLGICLVGAMAAYEAAQLLRKAGYGASVGLPVLWTPLAIFAFASGAEPSFQLRFSLVAPGIALLLIVAALPAIGRRDPADGHKVWLGTVFAGLYSALLGFSAVLVGIEPHPADASLFGYGIDTGRLWLLILVATVWTLDSAAYVTGRFLPRGRFFNHISPKKTWSGAIGGTIAAAAVCTLLFAGSSQSVLAGALVGLVIAVAAQLGDLVESMLKRAAGAKDSGTMIPGHGGFLDRVDSFLFAAPALYAAAVIASGVQAAQWL